MPKLFDLNKNNPYVNSFLKLPKSADDFKKKKENKQLETIQKEKTKDGKKVIAYCKKRHWDKQVKNI